MPNTHDTHGIFSDSTCRIDWRCDSPRQFWRTDISPSPYFGAHLSSSGLRIHASPRCGDRVVSCHASTLRFERCCPWNALVLASTASAKLKYSQAQRLSTGARHVHWLPLVPFLYHELEAPRLMRGSLISFAVRDCVSLAFSLVFLLPRCPHLFIITPLSGFRDTRVRRLTLP